ncbi:MAG: hypothetical protein QXV75_08440 [Candidatus Bathyarchaeia archaeon]
MGKMEIIHDWEWVIYKEDLDANNEIRLEDAETSCALIREIGTDSANTISFGVEDITYIRINKLIAPFYKSSHNLNRMHFSKIRDGKWVTTGYELPVPIDSDISIHGLGPRERVYVRGTLFKGVLRADDPINRYLRARMVEVPYKRLHPLLYENVTIPTSFTFNKKYILRAYEVPTPVMEEWDPTNPKYTIVPEKNTKYILNNPIQVLWDHKEIPPEGVEFRIWYDGTEDLKVRPRLDHMLLPPSDGKSKWTEETFLPDSSAIKATTIENNLAPGTNVMAVVATGVPEKFVPGMRVMVCQSGKAEIARITEITPGETSSAIYLDKLRNSYTGGVAKIVGPLTALEGQPLEPVNVKFKAIPYANVLVDPKTGEVFIDQPNTTSGYVLGYFRHIESSGKDIFTMARLDRKYRELEDPHKLTFMFINKYGNPTIEGKLTLYTLAQIIKATPPEVQNAVQRTWAEVATILA